MSESSVQILLDVHGMWCTSCARALEKVFTNAKGVYSANVNFTSGGASVMFDEERTSVQKLSEMAAALGYPVVLADDTHGMHALELEKQLQRLQRRLIVAIFLSMWIMLPQWVIYFDPSGFSQTIANVLGWLGITLSLPLIFYSGGMFLRVGWRTLLVGAPGMDTLVSLGSLSSLTLSVILLIRGQPYSLYLDTGTTLVVLLLIARYIDLRVRAQAGDAVKALTSSIPVTACLLINGVTTSVPTKTLVPGDIVRLQSGDTAQGDGIIVAGSSDLDQSFLTGESLLKSVSAGDRIEAGAINLQGVIDYQIDTDIGKRRIDAIVQSVRQLVSQKGDLQALTDIWSSRLSLAIVPLAFLAGIWVLIQGADGFSVAQRMLTVIVVTCPCALSLAIPLAFRMTVAGAAEDGIIIRHARSVERATRFDCIVFDKTGTLTEPGRSVAKIIVAQDVNPIAMLAMAVSLAKSSQHPMAQAILQKAKSERIMEAKIVWLDAPIEMAGKGISAVAADGTRWFLGRPLRMELTANGDEAMSSIQLRRDGAPILTCFVYEFVRPEVVALLRTFRQNNMQIWLASGDHSQAVLRCAQAVGIQNAHCRANCLPDDKAQLIKELQTQGLRVVFVGDGINDAPAMAAADLSIAVQGASRIAQTSASVVMTRGDLSLLPQLLTSVLTCRQRMQQNLWWAILYNIASVPAAMLGWISPSIAAATMLVSSISVTMNSTRR